MSCIGLEVDVEIVTTEMHTGGEPLRIVESGFPAPQGATLLEKRAYARTHLDRYRRLLMCEPRGHNDMYGAVLVAPDAPGADMAVLFIHNEGYSTMCGHAIIALARYAVKRGLVTSLTYPETTVKIQCPCGLVPAQIEMDSGRVRFHSVPAFAYALDVPVHVPGHGSVKVDIGYGGAFYAFLSANALGLDLMTSPQRDLVDAASIVTEAVKSQVTVEHPDAEDLGFIYGTILTDGSDVYSDSTTTYNLCIFADKQVDRSPTGSGVTARVALQFARKQIGLNQTRTFKNCLNGSAFTGKVETQTVCGKFDAVTVEVSGYAHFSGSSVFTLEKTDPFPDGFLLRH